LWSDVSSTGITYDSNYVYNEGGPGIQYEISCFGTISNNTLTNNGWSDAGWWWGGGISVNASHDVLVTGNVLLNNYNGIMGVQQNRGSDSTGACGNYVISNLTVSGNTTVVKTTSPASNGAGGLVTDDGATQIFSNNDVFSGNTYYLGPAPGSNTASKWFAWIVNGASGGVTAAQWQAAGEDTTGEFKGAYP
jgi:parallel beta-helix repeat protein